MSDLSALFSASKASGTLLASHYEPSLVLLSLLMTLISSCMALQVAGLARISVHPLYRQVALFSGSLALGGGVWAMHFIGMLAFHLHASVSYSVPITLLSIIPGLLAGWVALGILTQRSITRRQLLRASLLVGCGISTMHYTGMAAMQTSAQLRYDPLLFSGSIVLAVLLAMLALWVRFALRGRMHPLAAIGIAGLVMGLAISGMHYTGMAAVRFNGNALLPASANDNSYFIATAVAVVSLLLTLAVLMANALLRHRQLLRGLQENSERMQAILNTAVDGIVTIDERGIIRDVNPAVEQLLGWRSDQLIGQNVKMLVAEPHQSAHDGYLQRYHQGLGGRLLGSSREVDALHKDGRLIPIRLGLGKAHLPGRTLFVGFISDLSQRKAMEAALRKSELQYRSLISNIPGVAFRCLNDRQWSMLFVSDAVQQLTGWSADDFISLRQNMTDLYHPEDIQRVADEVQAALAQRQPYSIEYRLHDRSGRERWIWERGCGVWDEQGQLVWIDGVLIDNSESKRRTAEFEGIARAIDATQALIEFDMQGRVLHANANYLALSGYRLEDILGREHRLFCRRDELQSVDYEQFWARLLGGESVSGEFLRLGKGGRELLLQAHYSPIYDADGKPCKIIKFATDISPRRAMEQALHQAKEQAEQAAAAKSAFLANMSHEIRTPMNAIIGFSELLLDSPLDDQQRRHLSTVRQSARSLLGLLNDILDSAKLERGAVELELQDFSLRELCTQLCETLRLGAEAKGLSLLLDYPAHCPEFFRGDALRIQQVLTNLLGNAVKFTERGSVRLQVECGAEGVQLSVHDTGIGIAEERLARIFQPFAQAEASMARRFGGTGLGTTIARQLVDCMGGQLHVQSRLGEGSCFTAWLPLHPGQAPQPVVSQLVELPPLHILAADDVPQNLELLSLLLGARGHRLVTASDGRQALEHCLEERFDLVLMDMQMPGMDGLEATRQIRRYEREQHLPATPVIALSANVLEQDRQQALAAGMDGFASKPLELDRLLLEMARVLGIVSPSPAQPIANAPLPVIDWLYGRRLWGSETVLVQALQRFIDDHAQTLSGLATALREGRQQHVLEGLHRLRGAAANLGLQQFSQQAGELEDALRNATATVAPEALDSLQLLFDSVGAALPESPRQTLPKAPPVLDSPLREAARQLAQALRHGELHESALATLQQGLAGHSLALQQALEHFDFNQALTILDGWLKQPGEDR